MAHFYLGLIAVSVAVLAGTVSSELAISVDISEPQSSVGSDVEVRCHVVNEERKHFYVVWVKKVGTVETEISTLKKVNQLFEASGRYTADMILKVDNDLSDVTFVLTIKNLSSSDSGEIGCKIPGSDLEVFTELTVKVPFSSVAISSKHLDGTHHVTYSNGQSVFFDEGERRNFYCRASGGYPKPEMTLMLGEKNMETEFNKSVVLQQSGSVGLRSLTYDIEMTNPTLEITYEFSKKVLKCSANIPGTGFSNTTNITIELNGYKPQFLCDPVKRVPLHSENVNLTCMVLADPPINQSLTKYYWQRVSSGNDTINPGGILGHIEAFLEDGATENEKKMTLSIEHVYTHHFRTYFFEASNSLGQVTFGIDLERDPNYMTVTVAQEENDVEKEVGPKDNLVDASSVIQMSLGLLLTTALATLLM